LGVRVFIVWQRLCVAVVRRRICVDRNNDANGEWNIGVMLQVGHASGPSSSSSELGSSAWFSWDFSVEYKLAIIRKSDRKKESKEMLEPVQYL
jgi:hypothetical protein